jgi:hypothetical protein
MNNAKLTIIAIPLGSSERNIAANLFGFGL